MFKIFYKDREVLGETKGEWDIAEQTGIQVILVKCDMESEGKSRVGWYRDNPGLWGEYAYYWWGADDKPTGVTPDAVLDRWKQKTGRTDVTLADLSLDDFASIGVKLGRSIDSPDFEAILQRAVNDEDIR